MDLLGALAWATALLCVLVVALGLWIRALLRRLAKARFDGRSQATRYGQITEQFAPFLQAWPWDPKGFRFLGSPVDGIQFNPDGIVFVEVKSATSRLSPLQREVRAHVEQGRVQWREVRIG